MANSNSFWYILYILDHHTELIGFFYKIPPQKMIMSIITKNIPNDIHGINWIIQVTKSKWLIYMVVIYTRKESIV